jgi:hypothetical protein
MTETVISSNRLRNSSVRSTWRTCANSMWWLTQMMPIVAKLVTYVTYDGHWASSAGPRLVPLAGTCSSTTSRVAATANTPSLNASRRPVVMPGASEALTRER